MVSSEASKEIPASLREGLSREVGVSRLEAVKNAHAAVLDAARQGAAVALIRNTVDEAIASHATLAREFCGETLLFHARFAMGDRLGIEETVVTKFGRRGERRAGILVATQVIEQSLDLDFDFLVTDLAPVDLLIQRAGRLWRHMDTRPTADRLLRVPRMMVISAEPTPQAGANWLDHVLPKTKFVYGEDTALLWRSAKVLFDARQIVSKTRGKNEPDLSGEIRSLIEAVYGENKIKIPDTLAEAENYAIGKVSAEGAQARYNVLDFDKGYDLSGGRWEVGRARDDAAARRRNHHDPHCGRRGRSPAALGRARRRIERRETRLGAVRGFRARQQMRRRPRPSARVAPMIAQAQRDWTVSEREMPVLILSEDPESPAVWRGRGAG